MDIILGTPITFQTLYVNSMGVPFAPLNPTISIFYYNPAAVLVTLVNNQPMFAAVPVEVGRYVYTYTFSGAIPTGTSAYASFLATDPVTASSLRSEQELNLMTLPVCSGINTRFVR